MAPLALRTASIKPLKASARAASRVGLARRAPLMVRNFRDSEDASTSKKASFKTPSQEEVMESINSTTSQLSEKVTEYWENSEDKPTLIAVGAGSLLALYFANSIVSAVNRLPLFAGFFELVGIAFSGWTAYRIFLVEGEKEKAIEEFKGFVSKIGIKI